MKKIYGLEPTQIIVDDPEGVLSLKSARKMLAQTMKELEAAIVPDLEKLLQEIADDAKMKPPVRELERALNALWLWKGAAERGDQVAVNYAVDFMENHFCTVKPLILAALDEKPIMEQIRAKGLRMAPPTREERAGLWEKMKQWLRDENQASLDLYSTYMRDSRSR